MAVTAVVVAYNRRDLLAEVLAALASQTTPVDSLVVVDNASDDGSASVVRDLAPEATLVELRRNTGGAGGFAVGMATATVRHRPDWIWVMDDDTVPEPDALSGLLDAVERYPAAGLVGLGSRVIWTDGTDHPMNSPRTNPFAGRKEREDASAVSAVEVRSLSFVSSMYSAAAIEARGYPTADYFLWNDDFEFSTRVLRGNRGLSVPSSVVVHKTKALASTDVDPGPRFYLEVRNKIWMFRFSRSLSLAEKVIYGGSTVVRWARTFLRSEDRRVLLDGLRRGLRDGRQIRPRSNAESLLGAGVPDDVMAHLESAAA